MSLNVLREQIQKNIEDARQEQRQIHAQIQENVSAFNEEWSRWTTPRKIKRRTQERNTR